MKTKGMMVLAAIFALATMVSWSDMVSAQNTRIGLLEIRNAWVRESVGPAKTAAAYLELYNGGKDVLTITGVNSESVASVRLHATVRDGEVMRMRSLESIAIAPGQTVALQPGGMHIMFMGVHEPLRPGMLVDLTLTLSNGRVGRLNIPVLALNSNAEQGGHQHGGPGGKDTLIRQGKHKH